MSLHVLAGSSIADHSAALTNIAALLNGGKTIGSEQAAQWRRGGYPGLIGIDCQEWKAALLTTEQFRVYGGNWRSTDYIRVRPEGGIVAAMPIIPPIRNPYLRVGGRIQFDPEEDFNFEYQSSGAVDHMVSILLSYGAMIPPKGGPIISRSSAITAGDYGTTANYGTPVNITDLNPNKLYRIHAIGGYGGADCGIIRVSAPSFDSQVIQVLVPEGVYSITPFPLDSLLVPGVETLAVDMAGGAASASYYDIFLEEYGPWRKGQTIPGMGGGGRDKPTKNLKATGARTTDSFISKFVKA